MLFQSHYNLSSHGQNHRWNNEALQSNAGGLTICWDLEYVPSSRFQTRQATRKVFVVMVSTAPSMSLLPWQGEKVADRPDEGLFAVICRLKILHSVARKADTILEISLAQ